jgi:DNA polymerase elongation subunit (family B)
MKTFPHLKDILFIDIETISAEADHASLSAPMQQAWDKKMQYLSREDGISIADLYFEKAGVYAEFGKIIVIAAGFLRVGEEDEISMRIKSFAGEDEKDLLLDFKELVEKFNPKYLHLCAHNGKEFDFPYLCRRMVVHGIELPNALDLSGKKAWQVPHLDTMEMWKYGDRKNFTSLDLLAALFAVEMKEAIKVEGSEVNRVYYEENDLERIINDCRQDVAVLAQVYLKLKSLPSIAEENISFV